MNAVPSIMKSLPGAEKQQVSDESLLKRFIHSHDEEAFATLMGRYAPLVWSVCRRQLNTVPDAEDAFQATFLILARKAGVLKKRELLGNWLHGVARRTAWNLRKKQLRRARHEKPGDRVSAQPDPSELSDHELLQTLDEEIAKLPIRYRLPLLLCSFQGMTQREAANALDWPKGTIAVNLSRGKEILQKRLALRGYSVASVAGALAVVMEQAQAQVPAVLLVTTHRLARESVTVALSQLLVSPTVRSLVVHSGQQLNWLTLAPFFGLGLLLLVLTAFGVYLLSNTPPPQVQSGGPINSVPVVVPQPQVHIALPADAGTVILDWKQSGLGDHAEQLRVMVFADGRWQASRQPIREQPLFKHEGQFSPVELQSLMHFLTKEKDLMSFQPAPLFAMLKEKYVFGDMLDKRGDQVRTAVMLRTADRQHQFQWDQVDTAAVYFGQYLEIQHLVAAKRRIYHLIAREEVGGQAKVERIVAQANQLLLVTYPKMPLFVATDLIAAQPLPNAPGQRITLVQGDKFGSDHFFSVVCDVDPDEKVRLYSTIPGASRQPPTLPLRAPPK